MDTIKNYIVGVLMFTFIIVGGVTILGGIFENDPTFGDAGKYQEFNNTFNVLSDVSTNVNNIQSNVEGSGASSGFNIFGVVGSLINSAWSSLKLIISSFSFMTTAYNGLSTFFGVPAFIPSLIILIVITVLGFALYKALFLRS